MCRFLNLGALYRKMILSLLILFFTPWLSATTAEPLQSHRQDKIVLTDNLRDISLTNIANSIEQLKLIHKEPSRQWQQKNSKLYYLLYKWLQQGALVSQLSDFGMTFEPLSDTAMPKFLMTGYFSPIIQAKKNPDAEYRYPIYKSPSNLSPLPTRQAIYAGALAGKQLEIAYTKSLVDNFFLSVQGSGYLYLCDIKKKIQLSYASNNGYPYRSLGSILVKSGKMSLSEVSLQSLKKWLLQLNEEQQKYWMSQNPTFIFYKEQNAQNIKGAYGIELLPQVAIATDPALIPAGSVLLVEYPLLDNFGKFTGHYSFFIAFALDKGRAIKGKHIDIYQGIGEQAEMTAGYYKHYGRIWRLKLSQ